MENKMKWMYDGHREAMKQAVAATPAISEAGNLRGAYAAALYLLTGMESVWPWLKQYANMDGIDFKGMLNEPISSGERLIVGLSGNLLYRRTDISFTPIDLIDILDDTMFELAINGIILRQGRPTMAMLER